MVDPVLNKGKVTVSTGYDASATSIVLSTGDGAKLPAPATDGAFNLVWYDETNYPDPTTDPNYEIVRCTARSTDTLTVTRSQESTSATTKNTGGATYKMLLSMTKKTYDDLTTLAETRHIWLGAESCYLPATAAALLVEVVGSTVYAGWSYLAFDDTVGEHAVWRVPLEKYDGGNITVTAFAKPATTPSGAVTLIFSIYCIGVANSETFDTAVTAYNSNQITFSLNTTELNTDLCIASNTINPANVAADDLLVLELERDTGSDTLSGDGHLLGVLLEYGQV